jgi:hypothetical protein
MPNNDPASEAERPPPRRARDEAQLMLGQIHGVVWLAVNEVDEWLVVDEEADGDEPALTADDLRRAGMEVHGHFGMVQAALDTGACDLELERVGFAGAQGEAKRKGLWSAIKRFVRVQSKRSKAYITNLRSSLRWSETVVGSITAALKQEADRVPGAASAGEAIKEFIEVHLNATEPIEGTQLEQRVNGQSGAKGAR